MIDIDIQISISERSSGWATNYLLTTSPFPIAKQILQQKCESAKNLSLWKRRRREKYWFDLIFWLCCLSWSPTTYDWRKLKKVLFVDRGHIKKMINDGHRKQMYKKHAKIEKKIQVDILFSTKIQIFIIFRNFVILNVKEC